MYLLFLGVYLLEKNFFSEFVCILGGDILIYILSFVFVFLVCLWVGYFVVYFIEEEVVVLEKFSSWFYISSLEEIRVGSFVFFYFSRDFKKGIEIYEFFFEFFDRFYGFKEICFF